MNMSFTSVLPGKIPCGVEQRPPPSRVKKAEKLLGEQLFSKNMFIPHRRRSAGIRELGAAALMRGKPLTQKIWKWLTRVTAAATRPPKWAKGEPKFQIPSLRRYRDPLAPMQFWSDDYPKVSWPCAPRPGNKFNQKKKHMYRDILLGHPNKGWILE